MRRILLAALAFSMVVAACARASDGGAPGGGSGIQGVVVAGPQCPVETAESPCPDQPVPNAEVEVVHGGDVVARATTDADGAFQIALSPGAYSVQAVVASGGVGFAKPVDVTVRDGVFAQVSVVIDTGIR